MAAAGFQIATAYVDVEARFSAAQLRAAVTSGLNAARPGIRAAARTTIGRAIVDGIAAAFSANALRLEMALHRALKRLIPIALAGGRDIGDAIMNGIISNLSTAALRARLQAMVAAASQGLTATVDVNVRRSSLDRAGDSITSAMKKAGKAAGVTLAGALITSATAGLVQNAAILTTELVNLVGVVGLLPGAALTAGVAFGTLRLAFLNVGAAISAGLEGDMKGMNKLLDAMPPKAQEATKALFGLIQGIRETVMTTFWSNMTAPIKNLAEVWVPLLSKTFSDVAASLGRMVGEVLVANSRGEVFLQWKGALDAVKQTIDNIAQGIPGLFTAMAPLFQKSSEMLANLTGGFDGLMTRFTEWANRVTSDGSFEEFVNKGLDAFGDLFKALKELGTLVMTVLGGISQGGGTVLEALGQAAAGLNDFFKNTEAGQGILTALGEGFSTISQIIVDLVKAAGPGLKDLLAGLVEGLKALAPAAGPVGEALGAVMTALAPLLPALGSALSVALTAAATVLKIVAPWIQMLAQFFGQLFQAIAPQLLPVLDRIGREILPIVMDAAREVWAAMSPLIPVLAGIAKEIITRLMPHLPELIGAFKELVPKVADLAQRFGGALLDAFVKLAPLLPDLAVAGFQLAVAVLDLYVAMYPLLTLLIPIVAELIKAWTESGALELALGLLVGGIKVGILIFEGLKWIVEKVIEVFQWLGDIFAWVWDKIKWIWDRIKEFAADLWKRIKDTVDDITKAWTDFWDGLKKKATDIVDGIKTTISGWVTNIKNFFSDLWKDIKQGWTDGWNWVSTKAQEWVDSVKNIIGGIKDKFVDTFAAIPGALKSKANDLIDFFNNMIGKVNVILPVKIGTIPRLADGGQIRHYASGGHVHGPGGPREDKVPAMLSNGEFVVNARSTRQWLPVLEEINSRGRGPITSDHGLPHMKDGGLLGTLNAAWDFFSDPAKWVRDQIGKWMPSAEGTVGQGFLVGIKDKMTGGLIDLFKKKVSEFAGVDGASVGFPPWPAAHPGRGGTYGDQGVWRSIVALIKSTGPISGSFGNAYRPGDPLWHGAGRAVDWMGYNQDALASFLASKGPLELIHRTNQRDYAYTRGKNKGSFSQGLMESHRNHIHIAMADGGMVGRFDRGGPWPTGTFGMNTSGHTEQVLTHDQIRRLSAAADADGRVVQHITVSIDPSKFRDIAEAMRWLGDIQSTARQFRGGILTGAAA